MLAFGQIDHDRARQVVSLLTVYSRSDGIDPRRAPQPLLDTFRDNRPGALDEADAQGLPPEFVRQSRGRFFSITAEVGDASTGRSVRRSVVELIRQPDRPFAVREWSTVSLDPEATGQESSSESHSASSPIKARLRTCVDLGAPCR